MKCGLIASFVLAGCLAVGSVGAENISSDLQLLKDLAAAESWNGQPIPEFNQMILDLAAEFPADGTHLYWWPRAGESSYDGGTKDVFFKGVKVMEGEPKQRTFCCGLTLEVFLDAYNDWTETYGETDPPKLEPSDWSTFQRLWFVEKVNGPGPSAALEKYDLGKTITATEAIPGDFVQIWRQPKEGKTTGSGHSVVFLNWVNNEANETVGMKYWSTQTSTQGINVNTEFFGKPEDHKGIAAKHTHFSRVILEKPNPSSD